MSEVNEDQLSRNGSNEINMVGKKAVVKGDVLMSSEAFAFVLKNSLRGSHCDHCLRKKTHAQRCSGCATTYYCNRECQRSSWEEIHKKECAKLRKVRPKIPPDTARLMARVILKLQNGGYDVEERVDEQRTRKFKDLLSHYDEVKENAFCQEHFTALVAILTQYIGEEDLPKTSELMQIYGKVLVNGYTITGRQLQPVGMGVYLSASVVDHSCWPNAFASFVGSKIVIRSLRDMDALRWQDIRISYIDVLDTLEARRRQLRDGYFFECACQACEDVGRHMTADSIMCGNPSCSHPVFVDTASQCALVCPECACQAFDADARTKYEEVIRSTKEVLDGKKEKDCILYSF